MERADGEDREGVLREAFEGYLPQEILWRQKEQFSDGVGYGWIDGLKAHAEAQVSDAGWPPPRKRDSRSIRRRLASVFLPPPVRGIFPGDACANTVPGGKSIACSSPAAIAWDAAFATMADPPACRGRGYNDALGGSISASPVRRRACVAGTRQERRSGRPCTQSP